ncbi:MAG: 50S ribosome-binding GTPase [Planctomycetes bacterium]|nr:50S ribosome-binding GTPase [Planctomycetota bacterium]
MWWLLIIPPAVWLGKVIYDAVTSEEPAQQKASRVRQDKVRARPAVVFEERGDFEGDKVVVIGRTGAGKSSLINMLHGKPVLATGPVASTTRRVEGVRTKVCHREVVLVDTPGYGEVLTAKRYADGLAHWFKRHQDEVSLVMLVIQADAKAHAEDKRILARVLQSNSSAPFVIVLTQVDKLPPVREPLRGRNWSPRRRSKSLKDEHIAEKIDEICKQFGVREGSVAPSAADGIAFNRKKLLQLIAEQLSQRQ